MNAAPSACSSSTASKDDCGGSGRERTQRVNPIPSSTCKIAPSDRSRCTKKGSASQPLIPLKTILLVVGKIQDLPVVNGARKASPQTWMVNLVPTFHHGLPGAPRDAWAVAVALIKSGDEPQEQDPMSLVLPHEIQLGVKQ